MDSRQAKRDACFRAAITIEDTLAAGWETKELYPDEKDESKFLAALERLVQELYRRGGRKE